jgi:lipid biosynthesis B12-binding/radical SAM protein
MSKILLISSNTLTEPYPAYPLGMAIVASALSSRGHSISQFDFLAETQSLERLRENIVEFDPDYVGISIRNIDNVDSFTANDAWTIDTDMAIIKVVKEVKEIPVVLGGPAFSIMPKVILDYVGADYGIVGDGGVLFGDLIEQLKGGQYVPSILGDTSPSRKGDMLIQPLWSKKLIDYYGKNMGVVGLQTKRGCPYSCAYCTYAAVEGAVYRSRDPGSVIEDILRLKMDYHVDTIFFTDSVFNDADGLYLEIIDELLSKEISLTWSAFFRPDRNMTKHLGLLKRSGLSSVEVGTDAASDTTLAGLNKPFCFDDVLHFSEVCLREDIPCVHYIMFGGPDETERTLKQGLENIALLENCLVLAFSGIRIFPRTPLHNRAVHEGIVREDDPLLRPTFYFSPGLDVDHMNGVIEDAFRHQKQRIFPPSTGQAKLKALNSLGYGGFLWHKLLSSRGTRLKKIMSEKLV